MKKYINVFVFIISSLWAIDLFAQTTLNYGFTGTIDRKTLENYLARSITMQGLCTDIYADGGDYNDVSLDDYRRDPNPRGAKDAILKQQMLEDIEMIGRIKPKFIGNCATFWNDWQVGPRLGRAEEAARLIHAKDPEIILQAAVLEIVTDLRFAFDKSIGDMGNIPAYVFDYFPDPGTTPRKFDFQKMVYDDRNTNPKHKSDTILGIIHATPDMSKIETQRWFFYLASQYISFGYESIHFGRIDIMDDADPNHQGWWNLLTQVRAYAAQHARRKVVLCTAHTPGMYYDPNPNNIQPTANRQLLFDFHKGPVRIDNICSPRAGQCNGGDARIRAAITSEDTLEPEYKPYYGKAKGGKTYLNWPLADRQTLPFVLEIDNTAKPSEGTAIGQLTTYGYPWGWDEISWFSLQSTDYKRNWAEYAYRQVQCLDPNAFFEMPGRRGTVTCFSNPRLAACNICYDNSIGRIFRAIRSTAFGSVPVDNIEDAIKSVWDAGRQSMTSNHAGAYKRNTINLTASAPVENNIWVANSFSEIMASDGFYVSGTLNLSSTHYVSFYAGKVIEIGPGFSTSPGCNLTAAILNDGSAECFNPPLTNPNSCVYVNQVAQRNAPASGEVHSNKKIEELPRLSNLSDVKEGHLVVFDLLGRVILNNKELNGDSIDEYLKEKLQAYPQGLYLVSIISEKNKQVIRYVR